MKNRNYLSIIILLIVTAFFSWKFYFYDYNQPDAFDIYTFPQTIGSWTSQELPLNKMDRMQLGSNSILSRRYDAPDGSHVYLYITYSPNNPKAVNPPEISYTEFNLPILDKGKKSIKINALNYDFKVNWLVLDNNKGQQIVYYWFKGGGIYTSSYWKQQSLIAFDNIIGKRTGSALIRISVDMGKKKQQSIALIDQFTTLVVPLLTTYLP